MRKINTGIINKFIIDKLVENEVTVILNRWNYLTTKDKFLTMLLNRIVNTTKVCSEADVSDVAMILKTLEEVRKELEENEPFHSYLETFCQMDVERYFSGGNDEEIPEKYRNEAQKILMYHFRKNKLALQRTFHNYLKKPGLLARSLKLGIYHSQHGIDIRICICH